MEERIRQLDCVTEAEYLHREEQARDKHEYRDGRIVAMAGGTPMHALVAANLSRVIGQSLLGKPCRVFSSDLKVRVNETGNLYYPDLSIVCGSLQYPRPEQRLAITNPNVLIEVASPSTDADVRTAKFADYRRIMSLEEFFIVAQDKPLVEPFYKQPNGVWAIGTVVSTLDAVLTFRSLNIEVPLREVYAGVEFPSPEEKPAATESAEPRA